MERPTKFLVLLSMLWIQLLSGQDSLMLSHQEFIAVVRNYHPLAFSYQLQRKIAAAEVQRAKGNFDPLLSAKAGEKNIDGTRYYEQKNIALEVPTWYGIDLQGSYNQLNGERLNPSDTQGGLYQFGLTIPLARNLLYDKRRALLEQAKSAQKMTDAEQNLLMNNLMLEAERVYWSWVKNFEVYKLQKQMVGINRERLSLTKKTFEYGERPAIDTVEAAAHLQNFEILERDAFLNFVKSSQELQVYLWTEDREIYVPSKALYPATDLDGHEAFGDFEFLVQKTASQQINTHAALEYYFQKEQILQSDRRLKWQNLLPKVDLTYNFFNKEHYRTAFLPFFNTNFQYGVKFEIPLFLRQARADYEIAKLKIEQNQADMHLKSREINTKIEVYKNELLNYADQINMVSQNMANYKRLLNAEQMRYNNGESSLFLINSRETKFLESQEKLLDLKTKFLNSYNQLKWLNASFLTEGN